MGQLPAISTRQYMQIQKAQTQRSDLPAFLLLLHGGGICTVIVGLEKAFELEDETVILADLVEKGINGQLLC